MIYGLNEFNQLKFLEQYNFKVENNSNGRYTEIYLINENGCIIYHVWPQFGDYFVFVSNSLEDYMDHKYVRTYNLNWFLNNVKTNTIKRLTFIELVELYIKEQLKNNNKIFEVAIK